MIDETETKSTWKQLIGSVSPGWFSFCGGIALLSFALSISFRIMDFSPGPILEKHYDLSLEIRREEFQKIGKQEIQILSLKKEIEDMKEIILALQENSHAPGDPD